MVYRRALIWVLRLVAAVEWVAFAAALMPTSWMVRMYAALERGAMPEGPVFEAVMRQVSVMYGLHGVAIWLIAADPERYRPLIWLTAVGYLAAAPCFVVIDWLAGMPPFWIISNGGSCLLVGAVVLTLLLAWRAAETAATRTAPP